MLFDGIQLLDSSSATNFTIESGSTLPVSGNNLGELFYKTGDGIYVYDGATWTAIGGGGTSVSANNTWTAAQRGSVSALTYGATVTPNFDASNNFSLSLTGNATVANPTGTITPGQSGIIAISQDATGGRSVAWGTYFKAAGGVKPTLSTAPNAVDLISYYVVSPTMIFISGNLAIA